MKKILSKLDKIGIGIFIVILINFVLLLFRYDLFSLSMWQYVQYPLFLTLIMGIVLIFKSSWFKLIALLLSVLSLILLFDQKIPSNGEISYMLNMLPHFIANGTFSMSEICYFGLLPIFIASYCVFVIATDISNKKVKS